MSYADILPGFVVFVILLVFFLVVYKRDVVALSETTVQVYISAILLVLWPIIATVVAVYIAYLIGNNDLYGLMAYNWPLLGPIAFWISLALLLFPAIYALVFYIVYRYRTKKVFAAYPNTSSNDSELLIRLKSLCEQVGIIHVPTLHLSKERFVSPRLESFSNKSSLLILPANINRIVRSISIRVQYEDLKENLLDYVILHEISHLFNRDTWFFMCLDRYRYIALPYSVFMLIYFIISASIIEINIFAVYLGHVISVSVPLATFALFNLFCFRFIRRDRESLADRRAKIFLTEHQRKNLFTPIKWRGGVTASPVEILKSYFKGIESPKINIGSDFNDNLFLKPWHLLKDMCAKLYYRVKMAHALPFVNDRKKSSSKDAESNDIIPTFNFAAWVGAFSSINHYCIIFILHNPLDEEGALIDLYRDSLDVANLLLSSSLLLIPAWIGWSSKWAKSIDWGKFIITVALFIFSYYIVASTIFFLDKSYETITGFRIIADYSVIIKEALTRTLLASCIYLMCFLLIGNQYVRMGHFISISKLVIETSLCMLIIVLILLGGTVLPLGYFINDNLILLFYLLVCVFYVLYYYFTSSAIKLTIKDDIISFRYLFYQGSFTFYDVGLLMRYRNIFIASFSYIICTFAIPILTAIIASYCFYQFDILRSLMKEKLFIEIAAIVGVVAVICFIFLQRRAKIIQLQDYFYKLGAVELLGKNTQLKSRNSISGEINSIEPFLGKHHNKVKTIPDTVQEMTIDDMYYYLFTKKYLGMKQCEEHCKFIMNCENGEGGFSFYHNGPPTLKSTHFAIKCINLIDKCFIDNALMHHEWAVSNFFGNRERILSICKNENMERVFYFVGIVDSVNMLHQVALHINFKRQVNSYLQIKNRSEKEFYYFLKCLAKISSIRNVLNGNLIESWLAGAERRLLNTRFDKHSDKFFYFLSSCKILNVQSPKINHYVSKALEDEGYTKI